MCPQYSIRESQGCRRATPCWRQTTGRTGIFRTCCPEVNLVSKTWRHFYFMLFVPYLLPQSRYIPSLYTATVYSTVPIIELFFFHCSVCQPEDVEQVEQCQRRQLGVFKRLKNKCCSKHARKVRIVGTNIQEEYIFFLLIMCFGLWTFLFDNYYYDWLQSTCVNY